MIRITSEKELLESFRPIDRGEMELPKDITFPLLIRNYMTWTEPSGHRVYIVFDEGNDRRLPLGIVFRRDQSPGGAAAQMCEWCHSVRGSGEVSLLSASSSSRKRVGLNLCRDLSCREKAEGSPGPDDFLKFTTPHERVRKVVERISRFARAHLF